MAKERIILPEEKATGAMPDSSIADTIPTNDLHMSNSVQMDHWVSLLVVASTCLLLIILVGIGVHLLSYIGHTVLIFSLGGLLAYALDPIVALVRGPVVPGRKRRSRATSALLVFLGIFGILAILGLLLSRTLTHQMELLARNHTVYEAHARAQVENVDLWLAQHGVKVSLSAYLKNPPANARSWGEAIAKDILKTVGEVARNVVEGFIVLLIALYFLIYSEEMRSGFTQALHERFRPYASQWQDDVNHILGGFVRGQLVLALTIGALAAVLCLIMGLRLWLLIGLFVVIASIIPVVGPIIGAVPAVIAAILSPDAHFHPVARVVILVIAFSIINEFGSKILYPKLVGAALGLHEVLVLFILLAGYEVAGLIGVLFAAPLTALTVVTVTQLYRFWQGVPPLSVAQSAQNAGQWAKKRGIP